MAKFMIDWLNRSSHVLINPHLPNEIASQLEAAVHPYAELDSHIWLASSGTEAFPKMIALSKQSMLASAKAVNNHLQISSGDPWLNVLPLFHTGGLAIDARAFLSQSPVVDLSDNKWNPEVYLRALSDFDIAYSSLTPTHVYDLVTKGLCPPKRLKGVVVGGGVFLKDLHTRAHALGWPLYSSYGMTEICSQVATSDIPEPSNGLKLLKHVQLRFSAEDFIEIKSDALLTGFVHGDDPAHRFIDPKVDGWFQTQDKGFFDNGELKILGRESSFLKIGGESINMTQLESVFENIKLKNHYKADIVLIDMPDERLGNVICIAASFTRGSVDLTPLIQEFHSHVLPIAKIRFVYHVGSFPRTDLFKLKRNELRTQLQFEDRHHV